MATVDLKVEGMTCNGCVQSIQKALTSREGVEAANANLDTGMVAVQFDAKLIDQDGIAKAIKDAGFEVAA